MEAASEIVRQLSGPERRVLQALKENKGRLALVAIVQKAAFASEDEAFSAGSWLQRKGLVQIHEEKERVVTRGPDGEKFLTEGFPERRVHAAVLAAGGQTALEALRGKFSESEVSIALAWWKRKGLGTIEKAAGATVLKAAVDPPLSADETFLAALPPHGSAGLAEARLPTENRATFEVMRGRPGLLHLLDVRRRTLELTSEGRTVAAALTTVEAGIGDLTPELLKSGAWKGREIRPYDVGTESPRPVAGKPHPLGQIIEEIRDIFVELGFQEIDAEYVHSAFWNLDALFIPQDHPAREMQDTFYLANPAKLEVPKELHAKISKIHEDGGATKSRGWGTPLDMEESARALLRTHTTVGTIRYLAEHPKPPTRVFIIGRVFRKETMDATHLPEFHQIEGIATEEGADFPMLLGILQEFYRRLGFPKLRWRPAYFPYTEPSMEVEVWTGTKWMELGGCGIFRPEVTQPLGIKTPVLAWGLGLERLAMMRLKLKDIRDLYISDLEWLRTQPLL